MSSIRRLACHLSLAILAVTIVVGGLRAERGQADSSGSASFAVLLRGARIGSETVAVTHNTGGWLVEGSGRLLSPLDMNTTSFEARYSNDWQPQTLVLQATVKGQPLLLNTTFGLTTATSDVVQGTQRSSASQQISPRAVVLPGMFFGAYEALALRLGGAAQGARLPVFGSQSGDGSVTVVRVAPKRISLGTATLEVQEYALSQNLSGTVTPLEIWTDSRSRLARLALPGSSLVVLREDLAVVMAREERTTRAGDDEVFIPANGFSLGATVSHPQANDRAPAVVLVSGAGPQDRDLTTFGVSVFGQLAGGLADAGYIVVRYDPRGVGRSGGRTESATLAEYADDAAETVNWLRKQRGVDGNRIAVAAYGDGGPIAMLAGAREKQVKAIALIAAPGRTGREVLMERQQYVLSQLSIPDSEKTVRVAMQNRVMDATVTGKGWETIPRELRESADTPWFRSWILFDPAAVMRRVNQPILVVEGALDRELPGHGERLETLARARKNGTAERLVIAGVNHLLVPAKTGDPDEYGTLPDRTIASELSRALTAWLARTLVSR